MSKNNLISGIFIEETTFVEVCHKYHIPRELLNDMLEEGLFNTQSCEIEDMIFDHQALHRIEAALRLHNDLNVNLPGAVLAIELLEKLEALRKELEILRKLSPK